MKKVYREYFCIPEHGNIPEKVFYTRFSLSILTVFICLVALCSVSYAWFTETAGTEVAGVNAANYSVSVNRTTGEAQVAALSSDNQFSGEPNSFSCDGAEEDTYKFRITADNGDDTASTGYCRITVESPEGTEVITQGPYYTAQIAKGESIDLNIVAAPGCEITFTPQWGTSTAGVQEASSTYSLRSRAAQQEVVTYGDGDTIVHSRTPEGEVLSIFDKEAAFKTEAPATRVVLGSYNEYEDGLKAEGISWGDGDNCGTGDNADTVRSFRVDEENKDGTVFITRYILAKDDKMLYFPEDSSKLFKDLSPYVTSVELGNISLTNVTKMSAMFKGCDKLERIYVPSDWSNSQLPEDIDTKGMFSGCTALKGGRGTTVDWAENVLMKWETGYKKATKENLYKLTETLGEILGSTNPDTLHSQLDALQQDLNYSLNNTNQLLRIDGGPCSVDKDGNSTAGLFTAAIQNDSGEKQKIPEHYGLYQVKKGDSPASIAEKFLMKEETLRAANGLSNEETVSEGDWLIIPREAIGELDEENAQEPKQEQQESSAAEELTEENSRELKQEEQESSDTEEPAEESDSGSSESSETQ